MAVYVCGDTHGTHTIHKLRNFRNHAGVHLTKDDYVIVCGDFGLLWNNQYFDNYYGSVSTHISSCPEDMNWSQEELELLQWYEDCPWTTLWIDGNHENFDRIKLYPISEWHGGNVQKISDSVIHLMRGEIYEIDGHSFFCMGGAMSTDRGPAVGDESISRGRWWWPQEIPSIDEWNYAYDNLEMHDWEVDFIITHDTPASVTMRLNAGYRISEVSNRLETIKNMVTYSHWFCGHMHCDERFGSISILYRNEPVNVEDYILKF